MITKEILLSKRCCYWNDPINPSELGEMVDLEGILPITIAGLFELKCIPESDKLWVFLRLMDRAQRRLFSRRAMLASIEFWEPTRDILNILVSDDPRAWRYARDFMRFNDDAREAREFSREFLKSEMVKNAYFILSGKIVDCSDYMSEFDLDGSLPNCLDCRNGEQ